MPQYSNHGQSCRASSAANGKRGCSLPGEQIHMQPMNNANAIGLRRAWDETRTLYVAACFYIEY